MKTYVTLCLMTILLSTTNAFTQAPRKTRRLTPRPNISSPADFGEFVGMWEYAPDSLQKKYFIVKEEQPGRFKFVEGFEYNGNITWTQTMVNRADGIYLKPLNGKLVGRFTSPNFRATHGQDITYRITLSLEPTGNLLYSVSSELEPERYHATKVNNGEDTGEVVTSTDKVTSKSGASRRILAEKHWRPFWTKFSNATYKKDFKTLAQLSCPEFYDGGGGGTAMDWFKMMTPEWHLVKKAVMSGTRPLEMDERNRIERITNRYVDMMFNFEDGKKWCFSQIMGD